MDFYYGLLYNSNAMLSIVYRRGTLGLNWSSASREKDRYRSIILPPSRESLYSYSLKLSAKEIIS